MIARSRRGGRRGCFAGGGRGIAAGCLRERLSGGGVGEASAAEAIGTGLLRASLNYREYVGWAEKAQEEREQERPLKVTILPGGGAESRVRDAVERARIVCDAQNFSRTIASRPG